MGVKMEKSPSAEELLRKIQDLEARHAVIKQLIYQTSNTHLAGPFLTETQYLSILQSMGQSLFIYDLNHRIIFWNRGAERVYGYTADEVIGRTPTELLTEPKDALLSDIILERTVNGECWSGQFPIKNKTGERFVVLCANTPFRDENGGLVGAMCVSIDSRPYQASFNPEQPMQTSVASIISNLALKVKLKLKPGGDVDNSKNIFENTPRGHLAPSPFGVFISSDTEEHFSGNLMSIEKNRKYISLENRMACQWKDIVCYDRRSTALARLGCQNSIEASGSMVLSNLHVNSTSSMDNEILWEELVTKQQIGQGSCGTVYHGLWYGSDVAVKVFAYKEFSNDVIVSFRKEVSLMKRLRHPNILLFMGAVTSSPQHLCIVTEFLPRGSLFRILQRNTTRLDWKKRLQMAIDIARGMNYLHHCNPPVVHRDLKSSNLLVDKNWTVKVGDFGQSRIKHQTYLQTKTGKGTPQWMAPESIRNENADEKSDVYSYGVVLWEIVTSKIPWDDLNPMQVIAAVGFMNRRLEIPKDVDPLWASLIESCWCSDPQSRPTFGEILYKLEDLKKKLAFERRR